MTSSWRCIGDHPWLSAHCLQGPSGAQGCSSGLSAHAHVLATLQNALLVTAGIPVLALQILQQAGFLLMILIYVVKEVKKSRRNETNRSVETEALSTWGLAEQLSLEHLSIFSSFHPPWQPSHPLVSRVALDLPDSLPSEKCRPLCSALRDLGITYLSSVLLISCCSTLHLRCPRSSLLHQPHIFLRQSTDETGMVPLRENTQQVACQWQTSGEESGN